MTPFVRISLPRPAHFAVGPCPHCGRLDTHLNDVPLTASCWGPEEDEHKEWSAIVPSPFNPYLQGYNPGAKATQIEYLDLRPPQLLE